MPRRRPIRTYDVDQEHVADVYAPRNPVERLIGGEVKVRRRVDVSDYDRQREGRSEHVGSYSRKQEVRSRSAAPSMMALHRPPVRFERNPVGSTLYRAAGLPDQVDTEQGFKDVVGTLMEPVPGSGRFGGPGVIDFAVDGGDKFGIRQGQVVRIPRPGLFDYDPRFRTVDEFTDWLKREGRSGVIIWRPYPEDEQFYEPHHTLFWFEG